MSGEGDIIKFKTFLKILARERCNIEAMDGNLTFVAKHDLLKAFCSIFRLKVTFLDTKVAGRVTVCFRGKFKKLPLKSQGDWEFSSFSPIFHLSLPKIWLSHHHKSIVLRLSRLGLLFHKVWLSFLDNYKSWKHLKVACF